MPKNKDYTRTPVYLDMTGEEFKKLIERKDPNDAVNTLQEVLAMFEGISDGETLVEYIQRISQTVPDNSVGSEQIKDNSVMMEDLNDKVKDKLTQFYDEGSETMFLNGARPKPKEEESGEGSGEGGGEAPGEDVVSTGESGHSSPIIVEEEEEP